MKAGALHDGRARMQKTLHRRSVPRCGGSLQRVNHMEPFSTSC